MVNIILSKIICVSLLRNTQTPSRWLGIFNCSTVIDLRNNLAARFTPPALFTHPTLKTRYDPKNPKPSKAAIKSHTNVNTPVKPEEELPVVRPPPPCTRGRSRVSRVGSAHDHCIYGLPTLAALICQHKQGGVERRVTGDIFHRSLRFPFVPLFKVQKHFFFFPACTGIHQGYKRRSQQIPLLEQGTF